ncbi:MAG TPA: CDP-diacylglycerol--glycerol-3-phosphate 3-phosphatidyltransferase [Candidatus Kapabacteria bacterium]|nr:CDP-diacylglycerol--glycerol-3-phosphate 3-phosphatidyltransferase [Candidatus Kapabacteria bacterium]
MSLPMILTVLRMLLAPLFYILIAVITPPSYRWAAIVFTLAAVTDWYDGYFARLWKLTSPLGAFLDPLADKMLTSAAFIAFAANDIIPVWCVVLIIIRDVYLTLYRMIADALHEPIKTSRLAKFKTFFQMSFIIYILAALLMKYELHGAAWINAGTVMLDERIMLTLAVVVTALTLLSAAQYTYDNISVLKLAAKRYILKRSPQNLS